MLTKCANPACSAAFRYLHEGKLFVIDAAFAEPSRDLALVRKARAPRHYWLCGTCCRAMTVILGERGEVKVIPVENTECCRRL